MSEHEISAVKMTETTIVLYAILLECKSDESCNHPDNTHASDLDPSSGVGRCTGRRSARSVLSSVGRGPS